MLGKKETYSLKMNNESDNLDTYVKAQHYNQNTTEIDTESNKNIEDTKEKSNFTIYDFDTGLLIRFILEIVVATLLLYIVMYLIGTGF